MIRPSFEDDVAAVLAIMCGAVLSFAASGTLLTQVWLSPGPSLVPPSEPPSQPPAPSAPAIPPDVRVVPTFDERSVVTWAIIREPILMAGPEDERTGWVPDPTPGRR